MSVDTIRESLKKLTQTNEEIYSIVCSVDSVDTTNNTCDCTPKDGSADLLGVRLMAQNQTGFLIIPKVNSIVVVTMLNRSTGYVALFSELSEIHLNGKNYDGLVMINDLVTKLNNLENKVNSLISTFNAHTHPYVNVSAPATTSPSTTPVVGTLTPTVKVDLENKTVYQGNG